MNIYNVIDVLFILVCSGFVWKLRNDTLKFILLTIIVSTVSVTLYNHYIDSFFQMLFRTNVYLLTIAIAFKSGIKPLRIVLVTAIAYTAVSIVTFFMIYLYTKDILNGLLTVDFMTDLAFSYTVLTVIMLIFQITVGVLRGGSSNHYNDDPKRDRRGVTISNSNGLR